MICNYLNLLKKIKTVLLKILKINAQPLKYYSSHNITLNSQKNKIKILSL